MGDFGRVVNIGWLLSEIHEAQAIEGIVLHVKGKRKEGPPALHFCVPWDGTPPTHGDRRFVYLDRGSEGIYCASRCFEDLYLEVPCQSETGNLSGP